MYEASYKYRGMAGIRQDAIYFWRSIVKRLKGVIRGPQQGYQHITHPRDKNIHFHQTFRKRKSAEKYTNREKQISTRRVSQSH